MHMFKILKPQIPNIIYFLFFSLFTFIICLILSNILPKNKKATIILLC